MALIVENADQLVVMRYANRRLYDPNRGLYVSIEVLKQARAEGISIVVIDARTEEDVTDQVLSTLH